MDFATSAYIKPYQAHIINLDALRERTPGIYHSVLSLIYLEARLVKPRQSWAASDIMILGTPQPTNQVSIR